MTARQSIRLGVFAIVAFALGLVVARMVLTPRQAPAPLDHATLLQPPRPLPSLSFQDQDGRSTTTDFFRQGWTIAFFGFTHCPDVCPTTLAALAQVKKQLQTLPPEQQPRVLLVTVDPERDTPSVLKTYVAFFDPSFLGATGTVAQIGQLAGAFMVPFAKIPLPNGGYTMDHGAGVYFVAPSGAIAAYSSPPLQPDVLARDYRATVAFAEGNR